MTACIHEVNETERDTARMATPALADQIEELFSRAEPRLQRIARSQRVAPDAVDDVVQQTLIVAWQSLGHLRDET